MRAKGMVGLAALMFLLGSWSEAQAGWAVGVRVGPAYGPYRPYYRYPVGGVIVAPTVVIGAGPVVAPAPVLVAPAPVVVQPAPVVVQPAPVIAQSPPPVQVAPPSAEPPLAVPEVATLRTGEQDSLDQLFRQLNDPNSRYRVDAAMQLGRRRVPEAVPALSRLLSTDRSPQVREAAARALGLIGSSQGLTALQTAAQADEDREVRHSAQFAAEVIRGSLRR